MPGKGYSLCTHPENSAYKLEHAALLHLEARVAMATYERPDKDLLKIGTMELANINIKLI